MGKKVQHPELKDNNYITSCIFKVKDKPAALYKCLGGFATNDVSLSKLESFQIKVVLNNTYFYVILLVI